MESTKSYLLKVVKSIIVIATLLAILVLVKGDIKSNKVVISILFLTIYFLANKFEVKFCKVLAIAGIIISII